MQPENRSSLEFRHPVVDRLSADEARDFLLALQQELVEQSRDGYVPADQVPQSAEDIVRWLVEVVEEGAEEPLGLIRGALERMDAESRRAPQEKLWEAACAVYCLAASRVLRAAAIRDQVGNGRVLAVPEGVDPVSAGLIVLALEGGKPVLRISQRTGTADYVHDIGGPFENGDWSTAALRRAIFSAIAGRNHRRTPWNEASSSDMQQAEWEVLRVVINDFRRRKQVLAIVVRNAIKDRELEEFASGLGLPILIASSAAEAKSLLGIVGVAGLKKHMDLFWELVGVATTVNPVSAQAVRPDPMEANDPGGKPVLPDKIPDNRRDLYKVGGCDSPARVMDVVFIHGLDGDSWQSWMADKNDTRTFWPFWLAETFPKAGVWTLGYAASSTGWREEAMPIAARAVQVLSLLALEGIGQRPLAIIAHSMGGILAKQVLRVAHDSKKLEYHRVADNAKAMVFISTPHSGSGLANFLQFFGFIARANDQVAELKAHAATLRDLHDWFLSHQKSSGLTCRTYRETREVRPTGAFSWLRKGMVVVDKTSADTSIADERAIPLDLDHISICKPASRDAQMYREIVAMLKRCETEIVQPNRA